MHLLAPIVTLRPPDSNSAGTIWVYPWRLLSQSRVWLSLPLRWIAKGVQWFNVCFFIPLKGFYGGPSIIFLKKTMELLNIMRQSLIVLWCLKRADSDTAKFLWRHQMRSNIVLHACVHCGQQAVRKCLVLLVKTKLILTVHFLSNKHILLLTRYSCTVDISTRRCAATSDNQLQWVRFFSP